MKKKSVWIVLLALLMLFSFTLAACDDNGGGSAVRHADADSIEILGTNTTFTPGEYTLEAAVYDIPVIFGPEYRKFREACDLVECGGGFAVHSQSEFTAKMDELLSMPDHLRAAGKASGALVRQNIGATEKILEGLPL